MISRQRQQLIVRSLRDFVREQAPQAYVHGDRARLDGAYLNVPVYLPIEDAWENAEKLQAIEDAWNREHENDEIHVVVSPSGVAPTTEPSV